LEVHPGLQTPPMQTSPPWHCASPEQEPHALHCPVAWSQHWPAVQSPSAWQQLRQAWPMQHWPAVQSLSLQHMPGTQRGWFEDAPVLDDTEVPPEVPPNPVELPAGGCCAIGEEQAANSNPTARATTTRLIGCSRTGCPATC
jgi:hypothetical protein